MLSLWGRYFVPFLHGLAVTVEITGAALVLAVAIGALLTGCKISRFRALRLVSTLYVEAFRATPVLVLLFIAYYGLGQVGFRLSGYWAATLTLGTFFGALFAEIFRGGLQGVEGGQREAAEALAMGRWLRLRKVVLPQAFLAILLPSTNTVANIIKTTSLVVTIGVADLMSQANAASSATFEPMDMYLLAGLMYLALYLLISRALGRWELHVQRRYG